MPSVPGSPSLPRIKRRAKAIQKATDVLYARALDEAAQEIGCQNYRHAQNLAREAGNQRAEQHETIFTATWSDPETLEFGTETLGVWLPKSWRDILSLTERRMTRHLSRFSIRGRNRLAARFERPSQDGARELIVSAIRELTFASATGLRPSMKSESAYPRAPYSAVRDRVIPIPGQDHVSVWCDPSGRQVIVDEPYADAEAKAAQDRVTDRLNRATW